MQSAAPQTTPWGGPGPNVNFFFNEQGMALKKKQSDSTMGHIYCTCTLPKKNLNFRIKTEPATAGADVMCLFDFAYTVQYIVYLAQKLYKYRFKCSNRDSD